MIPGNRVVHAFEAPVAAGVEMRGRRYVESKKFDRRMRACEEGRGRENFSGIGKLKTEREGVFLQSLVFS